jgi:hypothetical protein
MRTKIRDRQSGAFQKLAAVTTLKTTLSSMNPGSQPARVLKTWDVSIFVRTKFIKLSDDDSECVPLISSDVTNDFGGSRTMLPPP